MSRSNVAAVWRRSRWSRAAYCDRDFSKVLPGSRWSILTYFFRAFYFNSITVLANWLWAKKKKKRNWVLLSTRRGNPKCFYNHVVCESPRRRMQRVAAVNDHQVNKPTFFHNDLRLFSYQVHLGEINLPVLSFLRRGFRLTVPNMVRSAGQCVRRQVFCLNGFNDLWPSPLKNPTRTITLHAYNGATVHSVLQKRRKHH